MGIARRGERKKGDVGGGGRGSGEEKMEKGWRMGKLERWQGSAWREGRRRGRRGVFPNRTFINPKTGSYGAKMYR